MIEQIKAALNHNKLKKIVALILSTALWFFVMGSQDPVINGSYNVPISMVNLPPRFKALYNETQTVRVKLSAPRSYFVDYNESYIRAVANMESYISEGEYDVPVEISYPKGFDVESFAPNKIHIKLDPYVEKQIPSEVILNGSARLSRASKNPTTI